MTYCSVVTVLVLVGLTKKRFGHYAILKILSLRSPSNKLRTNRMFFKILNPLDKNHCQAVDG